MTSNSHQHILVNLVAGGVSGGLARLCVAPLDVVKIRFQVQVDPKVLTNSYRPDYHYKSIYNAFSTICKKEGFWALWKGNLIAEAMWISFASVQFASFSLYKAVSLRFIKESKYGLESLVSGGFAGLTATLIVYPLDLLRTRFAAQSIPKVHPTLLSAFQTIYRTQGLFGFYYGVCPSLWQYIPYAAMQFYIYDRVKQRATDMTNRNFAPVLAGALAGSLSKLAVLPLDVVKKRLQTHGMNMYNANERCPSLVQTIRHIHKTEGPKSFFKGAAPSILKATTQTAIVFTLFENTKDMFSRYLQLQNVHK